MESIAYCPICADTQFNEYLRCEDFTTSHESFALSQCKTCQFVFTNPRPSQEEIGNYYQSDNYISHTGGKKKLIDKLYLLARKITIRSKRKIIAQNSEGKTILDFGCGTGEFLKELANHGYNTFGVEPSTIARNKAILLQAGKISQDISEIREQQFNVITLWHVLEHLHDLNKSLTKLKDSLTENGTIFIAVPNLKSLDANYYKSKWAGYDVPRHLWHFSQTDMNALLKLNGFRLHKIIPMKLDAYYVSLLSESYQRRTGSKLSNYFNAFYNGLRSNFMARNNLNYSSLIYIARK